MLAGSITTKARSSRSKKAIAIPLDDADAEPEALRIIREIASDIAQECPKYGEMTQSIRQFAASRLSSREHMVLGVASPMAGDGCTTVALGLAVALADVYGNVLYVEAAQPKDSETLQEEAGYIVSSGLSGYLRNEATLEDSVLQTGKKGFRILPAGSSTDDVTALERLKGLRTLFSTLRDSYDITVVDLPPLLTSEDAPALASEMDGLVLVVSAGKTDMSDVRNAISLCDSVQIEGIMMNRASRKTPGWLASLISPEAQRGLV